jgi:hypothetical protein
MARVTCRFEVAHAEGAGSGYALALDWGTGIAPVLQLPKVRSVPEKA